MSVLYVHSYHIHMQSDQRHPPASWVCRLHHIHNGFCLLSWWHILFLMRTKYHNGNILCFLWHLSWTEYVLWSHRYILFLHILFHWSVSGYRLDSSAHHIHFCFLFLYYQTFLSVCHFHHIHILLSIHWGGFLPPAVHSHNIFLRLLFPVCLFHRLYVFRHHTSFLHMFHRYTES